MSDYKAQMIADVGGAIYAILGLVSILTNCWPLFLALGIIGAIILITGIIVSI